MERILACITPQSNSHRIIDKAVHEAEICNGEFYILNVNKGTNIFSSENSAYLLESLFQYGSQKGGSIHALCGDDIPSLICEFALQKKITKIIVGEPPKENANHPSVIDRLSRQVNERVKIEIIILKRENNKPEE